MIAPLALTRRGLGFTLGSAGLWASWLVIGLRDVWYLVALLAALVAVSLLTATMLARRARPDVQLSVTDPTPTAGDSVRLTATIRHQLPISLRAEMMWEVGGERLSSSFSADPAGPAVAALEWKAARRGRADAQIAAISVSDPLGLAVRRIGVTKLVSLLVLPRPHAAFAALLDAGGAGDAGGGETWARPRFGHSTGAPAGALRAYRSGDALREVHWKQSARQGELLVNLHEQTDHPERALLLDTDPGAYASAAEFEVAVSAAAALAEHWLLRGDAVRLHVGGEAPVLCASAGDLLQALAIVTLDGKAAPPAGGREGLPPVVLTGAITESLSSRLRHSSAAGSGAVYALRETAGSQVPDGWRQVIIPGPDSITAADPGLGPGG